MTITSIPLLLKNTNIQEIPNQASILETFYVDTGGSSWTAENNWFVDDYVSECNFDGVECDSFGNVISMNVTWFGLSGSLPSDLGLLNSLKNIDVSNNYKLEGTIPTDFGQLSLLEELVIHTTGVNGKIPTELGILRNSLSILDLSFSELSGSIPSELGAISGLTRLNLWGNELTGQVPKELSSLSSLELLWLDHNYFEHSTIPSEFGLLHNLKYFEIDDSYFSGTIPSELGLLQSLIVLELDNGYLSGTIPSELGVLSSLKYIEIDDNELSGTLPTEFGLLSALIEFGFENLPYMTGPIPSELGLLVKLETLYVYGNVLMTGAIPTELGTLKQLEVLHISDTKFTGQIPTELGMLSNLEWFLMYDMPELSGSIPSELGMLTNLESFLMYDMPELSGSLPSELGMLTNVTYLEIYDNENMSGKLPSHLGELKSLRSLYVDNTGLTGTLPKEIGLLENLKYVSLFDNELTGTIPTTFDGSTEMIYLDLSNNELTGTIPDSFERLEYLYLMYNQLTGTLPASFLSSNSSLVHLGILDNLLTGIISTEIGYSQNLQVLDIGYNDLIGPIPSELGLLPKLRILYLHDNNLMTGTIPTELGNLKKMKILDLSYNNFTGHIPTELGILSSLDRLNAYSMPKLSGPVPSELGMLDSIMYLEIYNNVNMSGKLPSQLGELTSLNVLYLDNIGLSGTLPKEIGLLQNLKYVSFSDNKLTGTIPNTFEDLSDMIYLSLSNNELTGTVPSYFFANSGSLHYIYIQDNALTGTISCNEESEQEIKADCAGPNPEINCQCCLCMDIPSFLPTQIPSTTPSEFPSTSPSERLSLKPSQSPSITESSIPTISPTLPPTEKISLSPSMEPSEFPSSSPTHTSSSSPSFHPTVFPTYSPSESSSPSTSMRELVSTFAFNNNGVGNMFDLHARVDLSVHELDIHTSLVQTYTINIYTRLGSFQDAWNNASAWNKIADEAIIEGKGENVRTKLPSDTFDPVHIAAEATQGFYIELMNSNGNGGLLCHNAGVHRAGDIYKRSPYLDFMVGTGNDINFGEVFGDRIMNAAVRYELKSFPSSEPTISLSDIPSLSPSLRPSSAILNGLPSPFPTNSPSDIPSLIPTSEPSSSFPTFSPSLTPTYIPSVSPSIVLPVNTNTDTESIHETNHNNMTLFMEYLVEFDENYTSSLIESTVELSDNPYGGDRRLSQDDYSPFTIISVESNYTDDSCTPSAEDRFCYVVKSVIDVSHHPHLFTSESIDLVISDASSKFFDESTLYNGQEPTKVSTEIIIILDGVQSRKMDQEEKQIFEDSLLQFFHNELLSSDNDEQPSVLVENTTVTYQQISHYNESNVEQEGELEATVLVDGVYLPPPNIEFGNVLVDTFNEDSDEFIEIIDNNAETQNETYFKGVTSADSRLPTTSNDLSLINILLVFGGTSIGFVVILFSVSRFRYYKRRYRSEQITKLLKKDLQARFDTSSATETDIVDDKVTDQNAIVDEEELSSMASFKEASKSVYRKDLIFDFINFSSHQKNA